MPTLLSLFQTLGAAAGFVSASILLWDRWLKSRPSAILTGHDPSGVLRKRLHLRVYNPSRFPLLLETTHDPKGMNFARDDSTSSAISAAMGATATMVLDATSERLLAAYEPHEMDSVPLHHPFETKLRWRRAQAPNWPWAYGTLTVRTTRGQIEALLQEKDRFSDETESNA